MAKSASHKKSLPRYDDRRGWVGGDSQTLYAFTDRRTGHVTVYPGGGSGKPLLMRAGPEADVRVASRAEAEEHWQNPLHAGWRVGHATMARKYGPQASNKIGTTMHELKRGTLKSSSGQKVTSRKQALAIGISQARRTGYKTPPARTAGARMSHATRKSPALLDKEIAEFTAKPKLGDLAWERSWSELLTEKHSKARLPTVAEVARALLYIENEYRLDGTIDGEQWAEGLAFGRYAGYAGDKRRANEIFEQLSAAKWLRIAERANYLSREQHESPRYVA